MIFALLKKLLFVGFKVCFYYVSVYVRHDDCEQKKLLVTKVHFLLIFVRFLRRILQILSFFFLKKFFMDPFLLSRHAFHRYCSEYGEQSRSTNVRQRALQSFLQVSCAEHRIEEKTKMKIV